MMKREIDRIIPFANDISDEFEYLIYTVFVNVNNSL